MNLDWFAYKVFWKGISEVVCRKGRSELGSRGVRLLTTLINIIVDEDDLAGGTRFDVNFAGISNEACKT